MMESTNRNGSNVLRPAIISTYVPRQCGLATFSHDLASAYYGSSARGEMPLIVAISDEVGKYDYPPEVVYEVARNASDDYVLASEFLNSAPIDIVCLQHEYGIFGGNDGDFILRMLHGLRKPVATTLHTVPTAPTPGQRKTLIEICRLSRIVTVLSESAGATLEQLFEVPAYKIMNARHGAPNLPFTDPEYYKETIGLAGRPLLITFGHLGPGKGIEYALDALAMLKDEFPSFMYLIVGATHPELLKYEGEKYRTLLEQKVEALGLSENVRFVNRYLSTQELLEYVQAADIYISPYPGPDQVSSGPLAFAIAAGKAVVATPYVAAKELLADGRGLFADFCDPNSFAQNIRAILTDPVKTVKMRKAAYRFGRTFTWERIGALYKKTFSALKGAEPRIGTEKKTVAADIPLQLPVWDHVNVMTDDTGMLQHSDRNIPNRSHGYCTDDNARLLLVACRDYTYSHNVERIDLIRKCASFIVHGFDRESGRMRNFMAYDRKWIEKVGSEDAHGRTLWAVGYAAAHAPCDGTQEVCFQLFQDLQPALKKLRSPRTTAYSILGIDAYLRRFDGDRQAKSVGLSLAEKLKTYYEASATQDWPWFEPILSYDNARLSEAALKASRWQNDERLREIGLWSADFLFEKLFDKKRNCLWLVGNRGWWVQDTDPARFDQQPLDAAAMVALAIEAHRMEPQQKWVERARAAYEWFLGRNDLGLPLADPISGGCHDGLTPLGVNQNMGAESSLSWMLAQLDILESGILVETHTSADSESARSQRQTA